MLQDDFHDLLELHDLAVKEGARRTLRRDLYETVEGAQGRHFIGIMGPRGAGKSVLLKQLAASDTGWFYLSVDTLPPDTDLFQLVKDLVGRYQYRKFLIDEAHFLRDATGALKRIHDFLDVRVVFTSSVALAMAETAHDLARRVLLHPLEYFSFREYVRFAQGESLAPLAVDAFLSGEIPAEHLRAGRHFDAYLAGGLLPFALEEPGPMPLLARVVSTIIARDIPMTLGLRMDELALIEKLLAFTGRSAVDGISYSSLSANLGITKYKAEQYIAALERAFVMQRVFPAGTNLLREPKVLLMPPLRLLHTPAEHATGGLREDFLALALRQANIPVHYLKSTRGRKTPDFLIRHQGRSIALEVGGKGKGRAQFKGVTADGKIVLAPGIAPGPARLPLHLAGMLARSTSPDWLQTCRIAEAW